MTSYPKGEDRRGKTWTLPQPHSLPPANSQACLTLAPHTLSWGGNPWGFLSPSCLLTAPTPCWRKEKGPWCYILGFRALFQGLIS